MSNNKKQYGHRPQAKLAFLLGGLSACVRFTALAAWIPLGLIISIRSGYGNKRASYSYRKMLGTLIGLCAVYGMLGVLLGCCVDRWAYGFWAIPFLGNFHFNVVLGHGSLYGTHPLWWYFYAGIPAICGSMLPFFLYDVFDVCKMMFGAQNESSYEQKRRDKVNDTRMILVGVIAPYIILHSFSEHKEFRFILPILPLICVMAADAVLKLAIILEKYKNPLCSDSSRKIIAHNGQLFSAGGVIIAMILLNYPHLVYLGMVHQRGPIALNKYLTDIVARAVQTRSNGTNHQNLFSIHYLMGCHSAPLYSHLHIPGIQIRAWHLDCSPDCRSQPEMVCESDSFLEDPLDFIKSSYTHDRLDATCIESEPGECSAVDRGSKRGMPDFIIVMQNDAVKIEKQLTEEWGMQHMGSIRHSIQSLSLHDQHHNSSCLSLANGFRTAACHEPFALFSLIDIHFEHMEIYKL